MSTKSTSSNTIKNISKNIGKSTGLSALMSDKSQTMPKYKCDRGMALMFFVLFLLVLVLSGTAIQSGSGNKTVAWALYAFVIIFGIVGMLLFFKGGKYKKIILPIVIGVIAITNMVALILSKPRDQAVPHVGNILFALVTIFASIYSA